MTFARRFAILILGLAVLTAYPARADDLVRVDVPDGYKFACHQNSDCSSLATTCDLNTPRCCEYDALVLTRVNDYNALKSKECTQISLAPPPPGSLTHPGQCTICEPESTHFTICQNNKCVYTGSDMSASDRRASSKSKDPNQTRQQDVNQ